MQSDGLGRRMIPNLQQCSWESLLFVSFCNGFKYAWFSYYIFIFTFPSYTCCHNLSILFCGFF